MDEFKTIMQLETDAPLGLHIFVVSFVMLTGGTFNGLTIYLKLRQKSFHETDVYIVALACLDIFMCVVICPQQPLIALYIDSFSKGNPLLLRQFIYGISVIAFSFFSS